jgi:hypothetical protein
VRILDGTTELAEHRRCFERNQRVEAETHVQALLEEKRRAQGSVLSARLLGAAAQVEDLLQAAFERGESAAAQMRQLLELLDRYGGAEFKVAVSEALEHKTPRASSVSYLLERRRRAAKTPVALPVDLSRRPDLADLHVNPHPAEIYDELTSTDEPEEH